ncbi:hypothetical protein CIC12_29695 [Burkholderia sp. SG-MS1]|uniref:PaaI family thioesterase n=1 Tax=Paraburkholderia sp. SG-MS1 TaxID=2023741 RepID=UPI001445408B|nr:PaaI family thioesterase [Paraburkholderia sp. SG-MS1]NKJ50823.1 hypothetical protein [Paraburkholderia sp. SG-MS1]
MNQDEVRSLQIESEFCLDQGFELISYGDGKVVIACEVLPRHSNTRGNAHGGVLAALLDTAMGLAVRHEGSVENLGTASLTVNYIRPARGRIAAHASLQRCGRTLAFCEAHARTSSDEIVATASAVFSIARDGRK